MYVFPMCPHPVGDAVGDEVGGVGASVGDCVGDDVGDEVGFGRSKMMSFEGKQPNFPLPPWSV
jgi:hypothetical protein